MAAPTIISPANLAGGGGGRRNILDEGNLYLKGVVVVTEKGNNKNVGVKLPWVQ